MYEYSVENYQKHQKQGRVWVFSGIIILLAATLILCILNASCRKGEDFKERTALVKLLDNGTDTTERIEDDYTYYSYVFLAEDLETNDWYYLIMDRNAVEIRKTKESKDPDGIITRTHFTTQIFKKDDTLEVRMKPKTKTERKKSVWADDGYKEIEVKEDPEPAVLNNINNREFKLHVYYWVVKEAFTIDAEKPDSLEKGGSNE